MPKKVIVKTTGKSGRGRKSELTKIFEANVAKYQEEGLNGRPFQYRSYHLGFYKEPSKT